MNICNKCGYSINHPFGIVLKDGTCSGCITFEERESFDWNQRKVKLQRILEAYKKKSGMYDCVVPVVGDAEDYYILEKVLELGLKPLVVSVNDYFKNDIGWHNLHNLITVFDVDSIVYNPDLSIYKELVTTSFRKYNHILLPFLQLHSSFPVHIALKRNIPLIIWGKNQQVEQVGKFSYSDEVQMTEWSRKEHDLFGVDIDSLIGNGAQLNPKFLNYYQYPNIELLGDGKVVGLYLSNYYRWDPLTQNKAMIKYGFKPQSNSSTYDCFERAGSSVYYGLHDLLKLKRVGYRKIDDHLSRDVRHLHLDLMHANEFKKMLVNKKVYIKDFFDWLGVSRSGYEWIMIHKLKDLKSFISDQYLTNDCELTSFCFADEIGNDFDLFHPSENFIIFGKGV